MKSVFTHLTLALGAFASLSMPARAESDLGAVRARIQEYLESRTTTRLEQAYRAARAIPEGEGGPAKRDERLVALLEVLQQIQQSETPNFNPADDPRYVPVSRRDFPEGPGGDAQFAKAGEEHAEKLRLFHIQMELLTLKKIALEHIAKFVQRGYPPKERARANALTESILTNPVLKKSVLDSFTKRP